MMTEVHAHALVKLLGSETRNSADQSGSAAERVPTGTYWHSPTKTVFEYASWGALRSE
jgi:hypothetical protein